MIRKYVFRAPVLRLIGRYWSKDGYRTNDLYKAETFSSRRSARRNSMDWLRSAYDLLLVEKACALDVAEALKQAVEG